MKMNIVYLYPKNEIILYTNNTCRKNLYLDIIALKKYFIWNAYLKKFKWSPARIWRSWRPVKVLDFLFVTEKTDQKLKYKYINKLNHIFGPCYWAYYSYKCLSCWIVGKRRGQQIFMTRKWRYCINSVMKKKLPQPTMDSVNISYICMMAS